MQRWLHILLFWAEIAQNQPKMLIFLKNHEISNFSKNRNIGPKCMKSKYDGSEVMLFRFAMPEHTHELFGGGILMHMARSWEVGKKRQKFDFKSRAHFRARIMARDHLCHSVKNFISYISSLYPKSIGPIVFAVADF